MPRGRRQARVAKVNIDFAFFTYLWEFYRENRREIRKAYFDVSRRFLGFNDPDNATHFLRQPQFEALEMYVFLKEYLGNEPVHAIFEDWMMKRGKFEGRGAAATRSGQMNLLEEMTQEQYQPVFERMKANERKYANYIYALTMGTGKTILMATCIFYEFILAHKYPKDPRFCHNALVFAPDKTVLQSLREIQSFDMSKVVPPEYIGFLTANLQFHYLEETGSALSVLDQSKFNIIVSNTQKIILKRRNKAPSAMESLFRSGRPAYETGSVYAKNADLYGFDEPEDEDALTTNQRFEKLRRLEQLGIYVDEAHHAFGATLMKDMSDVSQVTSLRRTIDELAESLERSGTKVVACYNYTGTPYVEKTVLPEVVYAYGLREAIEKKLLKKVTVKSYTNTKSKEFVKIAVDDFVKQVFFQERHEGMLPKMAFFASTIEELEKELRPAVEEALAEHGIPVTSILVNVGDDKLTTNDDIREFIHLDKPESSKQFILLVNKGREGWNCRSLFGVALFRAPKSKVFVLQATMRCLRSIGPTQQDGRVYLSAENREILEDELQQNFHISVEELVSVGATHERVEVRVVPPPVTVTLRRIRRQFTLKEKAIEKGFALGFDKVDWSKYQIIESQVDLKKIADWQQEYRTDISEWRERRPFSRLTVVAEVARYLNKRPTEVERALEACAEGMDEVLEKVNQYNEVLFDVVIPRLFGEMYEVESHEETEAYTVELVKEPPEGCYRLSVDKKKMVERSEVGELAGKSFHLDKYCFDSEPERNLFWNLLKDGKVQKVYFTGMLTHGQSEFYVQYIDPESHTVRSYYPDFLVQREDGSYLIIEVKGDDMIDDPVVQAKQEFAEQMAIASGMRYKVIRGSDADGGVYKFLLKDEPPVKQARARM